MFFLYFCRNIRQNRHGWKSSRNRCEDMKCPYQRDKYTEEQAVDKRLLVLLEIIRYIYKYSYHKTTSPFQQRLYETYVNITCYSAVKGNLCLTHLDNIRWLPLMETNLNAGQ